MAKIVLTEGDRTIEAEGKAIVAFVIDPAVQGGDDRVPNAMSLAVGYSQTKKLMFTVSSCLGSLLTQMEKNPITQIVLARQMTQYFTNAVIGVDTDIDVVEAKVTPAKEED